MCIPHCVQNAAQGHLRDWQALDARRTLNFARKTDLPWYHCQRCQHRGWQSKRSAFPSCAFRPGSLLLNCMHDWKRSHKIRKTETPSPPAPGREGAVTPGAAGPEPAPSTAPKTLCPAGAQAGNSTAGKALWTIRLKHFQLLNDSLWKRERD